VKARIAAVIVVAVLIGGGCGSSSSKSSSTTAQPTTTTLDKVAAKAEITKAFETYFDGAVTDVATKEAVLDKLSDIKTLYEKFLANPNIAPLLGQTKAKVTDVTLETDTTATVTYDVVFQGTTALPGQKGSAHRVNGKWLLDKAVFCDLAALQDPSVNQDPGCKPA
jgi:hypothetical protein